MSTSIEDTLKQLKSKVSEFTKKNFTGAKFKRGGMSITGKNKSLLMYGIIPVILTSLLLLVKPDFIMTDVEGESYEKKVSLPRLLITVVIGSMIFGAALFMYMRKKETSL